MRKRSTRSPDELELAAERLLKGCHQHFRAGVTRLKKINGVIPSHDAHHFQEITEQLLSAETLQELLEHAEEIKRRWPAVTPWISWWMREDHVQMLFESARKMDRTLWEAIPETTNAEESMHHKIYQAVGRDHPHMIEAVLALEKFAQHFETLLNSTLGSFFH